MRYTGFLLISISVMMAACSGTTKQLEGWEVTVRGKVGFPQNTEIVISEVREDLEKPFSDTVKLKSNYTFEKKIRIKEPGYYQINFYNRQSVRFILDKSDLEISVDGNDPAGFFEVKGSPDAELVAQVQKVMNDAQQSDEARALEGQFQEAARLSDNSKMLQLQSNYQERIMDKAYNQISGILRQAPLSLGLINILQNGNALDRDKFTDVYVEMSDKFKKEWPNSYHAKSFVSFVENMRKMAIGQPAPEISLPDPNGRIISLSSFKGKYVLVDFWAKWCGPCRRENPNVVKAYLQFKDMGFDILGVSLDRSRDDWVRAIEEDGLTWNHVSDLKYFESQAAKDYNINAIPFSILVDPKGIIVAKNLRGSGLQKKLEEVLNNKKPG